MLPKGIASRTSIRDELKRPSPSPSKNALLKPNPAAAPGTGQRLGSNSSIRGSPSATSNRGSNSANVRKSGTTNAQTSTTTAPAQTSSNPNPLSIPNIRISSASDNRKTSVARSNSKKSILFQDEPFKKTSKYKSLILDELPPCVTRRTRSSLDRLANPIDQPKQPVKYNPPFRRNFRYFGYPQNLNLDINTPPRVKSWGSIPEISTKSNRHKRRAPTSHGYRIKQDASFDPHWMGRLLKSNLLLDNPGLIPPTDKAAIGLGSKDKLKLIHPDFEVHNCPSELYFPITEKSRKAFCKINKMVQEKIDKQVHAFTVQNPTTMKYVAAEQVALQDEKERLGSVHEARRNDQQRRKSNFVVNESMISSDDKLAYEYDNNSTSPVIKTMCGADKNWPGLNRQLYGRPTRDVDDNNDVRDNVDDTIPEYGIARLPEFELNIPEDIWQKLAKIRQRQQQMNKNLVGRLNMLDPDRDKFRTFTQLELRDQVMTKAREDFIKNLKEDLYTPLPPELFQDNRGQYQPYHEYEEKGELPVQGPYWWKTPKEELPSAREEEIIEKFVQEARTHHDFTHHLPGLLYTSRHPFQPLELDWLEKGSEMGVIWEIRKTPSELHEMPAYLMHLDKEGFEEKLNREVSGGVKELVGPEIYELYRRTYGIQDKVVEKESEEDIVQEVAPPVRRLRRRRRASSVKREKLRMIEEEEEEEKEDEGEEEGEELGEEEEEEEYEEDEDEAVDKVFIPPEVEAEYKVSADLLEDEEFPLPDVRFSLVQFPRNQIPEGLKDDMKFFQKGIEKAEPIRPDEEEPKDSDNSDTSTDSEGGENHLKPEFSHDAASHLQVMYQGALKQKHKSIHRPLKIKEMEPPKLKDIFLMETYTDDIDHLLYHDENIPKFLQLF